MKRKTNLYNDILKYQNILEILNLVSKKIKNKKEIIEFSYLKNTNVFDIQMKLYRQDYDFSKYHIFLIKDPKYRVIMSEKLNDKIVNHLVSKYILLSSIEPCLIDTNVATRKNKGSKYALDKLYEYINEIGFSKTIYALKIDISKYFYNIDHEIILDKIRKRIKEKKSISIIEQILKTTDEKYINDCISRIVNNEILHISKLNLSKKDKLNKINTLRSIPFYNKGKGLPIGNMTSQILAVFYLNDVDHFIKEDLGYKYYIRYMDDLIILDTDKEKLKADFYSIKEKIENEKLKVNKKSNIYNLKKGVSFLGYSFCISNNKLLVRYHNKTIHRINLNLKKKRNENFEIFLRSKASYKGYFYRCNTALYYRKYKKMVNNNMYDKYLELKDKFPKKVVLIKAGKFYRTYDDDAVVLRYLMEYKLIDNKVGFPIEGLFKVRNKFRNSNIPYLVLDGDKIIFDDEGTTQFYDDVLNNGYKKYDCEVKTIELSTIIKEKLNDDINFYEKLKDFIYNYN